MTAEHEPTDFYATNRRNIEQLRDERDRAGLLQLADVLDDVAHADSPALLDLIRQALTFIDDTAPRTVTAADPIRVGDILTYEAHGMPRQGVVLIVTEQLAVTNLGDEVPRIIPGRE